MVLARAQSQRIAKPLLALLFFCLPLDAQEKVFSEWSVSFEGVPRTLQSALLDELERLPARQLSDWEREYLAQETPPLEKAQRQTTRNQNQANLDFEPNSNPTRSQFLRSDWDYTLDFSFSPQENHVPRWAPLRFNGKIRNNVTSSLALQGLSSTVDPLLILEISILERGKEPWFKEFAFSRTASAQEIAREIRDQIAREILGYEWVRLAPEITPELAEITLGGHSLPLKDSRLLFWPVERQPIVLQVTAEGYNPYQTLIQLEAQETFQERIELMPLACESFQVDSEPSGADIYLDNLWIGLTPFTFQAVPAGHFMTLQAEGVTPQTFPLNQLKSVNIIDLRLDPAAHQLTRLKHHRLRFYVSLTTLLLSLAPTAAFISLDLQADRLERLGNHPNRALTQGLLWSAVSLNLGALIWNIVESVLYVHQAEKTLKY